MKKFVFIIIFAFICSFISEAVPAYPKPIMVTQSDGSTLEILLHGDEHVHYVTTIDNVLIKQNAHGVYEYAKVNNLGNVQSIGIKAYNASKRLVSEKLIVDAKCRDLSALNVKLKNSRVGQYSAAMNIGMAHVNPNTFSRGVVILVNFSDKSFVTPNALQAFTNLTNERGYSANGGTGSARDFFIAASDSAFMPTFDVYGPYNLPHAMAYYGGNNDLGKDENPQQMIIDACAAADNDINFADYDLNNDGKIDNVCVYYAGYNEAEGGGDNTVWPHRWHVDSGVKFDGKTLYGYSCTSELKGSSGSTMCGVGTFCHEFGHVLGLPDMYVTDGDPFPTLGNWDIMCYGPYNNNGNTPPTYSAYERYFMGWLKPVLLNESDSCVLPSILSSNKAYMITKTGTSNDDGQDPNPAEFFLLENRQKQSWDEFLPWHGMLITHINYNSSTWTTNTVNNDSTDMGIDLVEADGIPGPRTEYADTYPGTTRTTSYTPKMHDGTNLTALSITNIEEYDKVVSFNFMGDIAFGLKMIAYNSSHYWNFMSDNPNNINYSVVVYSMTGQILKSYSVSGQAFSIDNSSLSNGVYIVRILNNATGRRFIFKTLK